MDTDKCNLGKGCPRGKLFATNWLDGISSGNDFDIVEVVFKNTRTGFYSNPNRLDLKIGDIVAVEGAPGHDIGRVSMIGRLVRLQLKKANISPDSEFRKVFRLANQSDMEKYAEATAREEDTMIRSRKIAEELGLDMKIGDVEYQGDGGKAIFYYIADERVDFRKLIRILADTFKVRIEMKQIGARQEAGRIGGIGPCGRPLCCSSWMTHFVSVGTGAARIQDLSMNPQKLAGQCAKLKCCLNFEIDAYSEAQKKLPAKDMVLQTKDADYYFFKADILSRQVTYSTDKSIPANLVTIPASRAFEIISLNRQGIKVDSLDNDSDKKGSKPTYVDLVEQESLTRFDNSKKRKKNRNKDNHNQQNRDRQQSEGNGNKEGGQRKKNNGNHNGNGQQERKDKNRNNRPNQQQNGKGKNNGNRQNNPNGGQQPSAAPKQTPES
ncbi:MAG: hypothetical protein K2M93_07875 [Muribaculaceae bacterium]|nr:hypothetical protein [Muribaculaceae bacterium]